ncbi:hypothetical protein [Oceanidesulfovibrio marinus]|uniref:Uncharacterized protein n=1 Tax=Oceanidesulfovibrio marinus TaxID=370038 RepID=A0A6P1ZAH5_9BACT|nr:hypothetical protein [Oceanidesulfovibrio marinus]QJT10426.1 hypothetical protein E8L03_16460 [Oceanidesulfovibrio marinus]TVM30672.1 hypothetical protein DQK91_20120 [Oceanidesulfovibrio marinus]
MSHEEIRVYGYVKGLPSEGYIALLNGLEGSMFQMDCLEHEGDTLNVEYEGPFFLIDDFLEALLPLLPDTAEGRIDYIDHHAWEMVRYTIEGREVRPKNINLNSVLEKYHQE